MGINTLNESELHRVLKLLYKENNEGSVLEAKYGPYIVDIKTAEGNVIEIQTQSLGHLAQKAAYFISQKKRMTVVYPLVKNKRIETRLLDGSTKLTRSPVHKSIYSSFRELTALAPTLLSPYFFLDTVEVSVIEERQQTKEKVQSQNGRRRYKQDWLKTGKRVQEVGAIASYHGARAWKALLPTELPAGNGKTGGQNEGREEDFCPSGFSRSDFHKALKASGVKLSADEASLMLWVYVKMGIIERQKKGRSSLYSVK